MLNIIEGAGRDAEIAGADEDDMRIETADRETTTTRRPYDWSNVVFAAQYCERARAAYDEKLAG